jgi:carbon-monoxide dehydrogenase large subunit
MKPNEDRMNRPNSLIGSPVERIEDLRFLRGRGQYVADLALPGMLHAVVLRSPFAHGRIRSIDTSAARLSPGVHAVFTAADIGPEVPVIPLRQEVTSDFQRFQQPVIAGDKVRYVGEPIAIVIAKTQGQAEDALDAVAVDIEPLPAVADRAGARAGTSLLFDQAGTNIAGTLTALRGDAEAAFATAPYRRRERFEVQRHTGVPMETRGLLAHWDDARGYLTVYGAAKTPFVNRRTLAAQLGMSAESISMVENDVGGGFGVRGEFYPEDFLVPFAARALRRPVKWIEDRREHLLTTNHARDAECELEVACTRDGRILALRGQAFTDVGAYIRPVGATPSRNIAQVLSGPYSIADLRIDVTLLLTNKTPSGTYRGPGRFEADFFRERLLDLAAADLGLDRVEFRRRNLVREEDMPYRLAEVAPLGLGSECDSGDYAQTLDRCLAEFGWAEKAKLDGQVIDGRRHGVAIGCYIEGGASGPKENARLALESDGTVSVYVGSSAVGQGVETIFAQIAADALGLSLARIRGVYHGSTDYLDDGYGSYSSRSTVMGGSAVIAAADKLKQAIRAEGARRLGCAPEDVSLLGDDGVSADAGRMSLAEIADAKLAADGTFASHKRTYSYGSHAAHVAVDLGTGQVAVLDYVAVEDVGRIINPETLHGQAMGAIVQGLGGTFLEWLQYDENGQLLTGSLADYLMPTATDFPRIRAVTLEEKPSPNNPLGAKGAGEGGIIPVGGVIANAVAAALRPLGVTINALPLSPPRVWERIEASRQAR